MIGALTSLLTATYMFRLVFLTFYGERRHDAPAPQPTAARATRRTTRTHGARPRARRTATAHLHDAPPAMALALIVLAIGSVLAGYIGVPHALGGHNAAGRVAGAVVRARRRRRGSRRKRPAAAEAGAEGAEAARRGDALELTLMGVSSGIAFVGIGIASFIWLKRRELADGDGAHASRRSTACC